MSSDPLPSGPQERQSRQHQQAEHLEPDDPVHVPGRRVAGDVEPVLDPLCGAGPHQAPTDADQPLAERRDDALGERAVELGPERLRGRVEGLDGGE